MLNEARKGLVAAKTRVVSAKDNAYLILSEVSCAIEKAAFDSLSLHDDLKQEIPDSEVLTYLSSKAFSSSALMDDFHRLRQIGSGNLQERFNALLSAKRAEFDRMVSQPFWSGQRQAALLPASETVSEPLPGIGEPLPLFQANPFEQHLRATM